VHGDPLRIVGERDQALAVRQGSCLNGPLDIHLAEVSRERCGRARSKLGERDQCEQRECGKEEKSFHDR